MRRLELNGGTLVTLTDAAPPPAAWAYSFPDAAIADHPDVAARWLPDEQFHTRFAVFAWVRDSRIMLVDAGIGADPSPYFHGLAGRLDQEMRLADLDPAAVDLVMFTHFHLDHVGWATRSNGEAYFANARYVAPAAELDHWRRHGAAAALPHHVDAYNRCIEPLLQAGRLAGVDADRPLDDFGWPEARYKSAPGHTAGHHAVVIRAARETVLIAGDAWHSPAQIAVPAWSHRADRNPGEAARTRADLAAWAREHRAIVAAGHFPEDIAFGRIERVGAGEFKFAPFDFSQR